MKRPPEAQLESDSVGPVGWLGEGEGRERSAGKETEQDDGRGAEAWVELEGPAGWLEREGKGKELESETRGAEWEDKGGTERREELSAVALTRLQSRRSGGCGPRRKVSSNTGSSRKMSRSYV